MPAFTVLHVCVGNICRSPMAERLLYLALRNRVGDDADTLYLSHGAGSGSWHVGEQMNPPAARQVRARGGDPSGFTARKLSGALVDASDLVLCATSTQVLDILRLRPDAEARMFVLGEFGRLLSKVALDDLPRSPYERGVALVSAADASRSTTRGRAPSTPADDLDDPWGLPDREFARAADEIEHTVIPLAAALTGTAS